MELVKVLHVMFRQVNAPFLISAAVAYAVAFLLTWWLAKRHTELLRRINSSERGWRNALIVLAIVYFASYTYLSIERYYKLLCGAWDLSIFDSLFSNALQGRFFQDFRGGFDHFQPIYILLVPFYSLWKDPRCLLILQTLVLTLAVWPLYLLACEVSKSKVIGAFVGILYLLYPLVGEGNLYDFHVLACSPLCFFTMLLFMVRRKWLWYWIFLVLTLSVKESEAIIVFGAGLYLVSRKDYLRGGITAAIAVAWFFASTVWALPAITGAGFRHLGRYSGLKDIAGWAYETLVGNYMIAGYSVRVLALCFALLAPLGFLFARSWRTFFLIFAPAFGINMVAKSIFQNILFGHYAITVASAAVGASALAAAGLVTFSKEGRPAKLPLLVVAAAALINVVLSYPANECLVYPKFHLQWRNSWNVLSWPLPINESRRAFYSMTPHDELFFALPDLIPAGSTVAAHNFRAYLFVSRFNVKIMSVDDKEGDVAADFYVFDFLEDPHRIWPGDYERYFNALNADPEMRHVGLSYRPGVVDCVVYGRKDKWDEFTGNVAAARLRDPVGFPYRFVDITPTKPGFVFVE